MSVPIEREASVQPGPKQLGGVGRRTNLVLRQPFKVARVSRPVRTSEMPAHLKTVWVVTRIVAPLVLTDSSPWPALT
jgi:hypothetical protein